MVLGRALVQEELVGDVHDLLEDIVQQGNYFGGDSVHHNLFEDVLVGVFEELAADLVLVDEVFLEPGLRFEELGADSEEVVVDSDGEHFFGALSLLHEQRELLCLITL